MEDALSKFTSSEENPVALAVGLVGSLRPKAGQDSETARARILALCFELDHDPVRRASFRRALTGLLGSRRQVSLYSDTGILPSTGFFTEFFRRFAETILPGAPDHEKMRDVLAEIFHEPDDAIWVRDVGLDTWTKLLAALRFDEAGDDAAVARDLRHSAGQILESLRVISYRISAIGLEAEVLRVEPTLEKFESPFLAQNVEALIYLQSYEAWLDNPQAPKHDERHFLVLLLQCRSLAAGIRRRAARDGTSFSLTFLLIRLEQNIVRAEVLVDLLNTFHERRGDAALVPEMLPRVAAFTTTLIRSECRKNDIAEYFRQTVRLMSLRITENASHTGDHYITRNRGEYFALLKAGLGAGFIIAFMALFKVFLSGGVTSPANQIIVYGLNYGLGFVLIHMLHFTVATKQPAMTANAIAASIREGRGKARDMEALATLIARTARSQFAAIMGNILLTIPTAILIILAIKGATGFSPISPEKAAHMLEDNHAWHSGSVFYAAIAGVFLFLSGLIAGYFDNLCAYNRIPERLIHAKWLKNLFGESRVRSLSRYIEDNLGALAGNFFFGFMLACGWGLGFLFGLPIDIRHITFASANTAFAVTTQGFQTPPSIWVPAVIGVILIGVINLAVSFSLALFVALRSRGATLDVPWLLGCLWRHFRTHPSSFFLPPKASEGEIPGHGPLPKE